MGLELVELAMEIEEEFDVRLSDQALERLRTAGDLHATVIQGLRGRPQAPHQAKPSDADVWQRLTEILSAQTGGAVPPSQIRRETRFVEDLGFG